MKKIIRKFYYLLVLFFSKSVRLLSLRSAVKMGGLLGAVGYHLVGKARAITEDNLRKAFPEKSEDEIRNIAKEVFINQGKNAFEVFYYPRLTKDRLKNLISIENAEGYSKACSVGKGVLMASAHCANWEFMGSALSTLGFGVNVIAKRIYIESLNQMLLELRNMMGMKVIFRSDKDSARKMLKALKAAKLLQCSLTRTLKFPGFL